MTGRAESKQAPMDFEATRLVERPEDGLDAWGRSRQVEVSEEPFDTLPAALQDELRSGRNLKTPINAVALGLSDKRLEKD